MYHCVSCVAYLTLSIFGAGGPETKAEPEMTTRVIPLRNLELDEAIDLLQELHGEDLQAVTGSSDTNQLIIRGSVWNVENAAKLIFDIDTRGREKPESATEFIPIQTYPMEELEPLLGPCLDRHLGDDDGAALAVDHVSRQLIVTASPEVIACVRGILQKIDQPSQTLSVHLFFLRGDIGPGTRSAESALPASLKPIAESLAKNGFGNPMLMAPFTLKADASHKFETGTMLRTEGGFGENQEILQLGIKGKARAANEGGIVQLDVDVRMDGVRTSAAGLSQTGTAGREGRDASSGEGKASAAASSPPTHFEFSTTLSLNLDRYVILALAPNSTQQGGAVALVVQVTRD